jgi:hypothetical protein
VVSNKKKTLTRDNLAKRREVSDKTCLFRSEAESVHHLFFDCCVAHRIWSMIAEIQNLNNNGNFKSIATFWIANKKHAFTNIITSDVNSLLELGVLPSVQGTRQNPKYTR